MRRISILLSIALLSIFISACVSVNSSDRTANANAKTENTAPLISAVEENNEDRVGYLLKHGADPNTRDDMEETALMKAAGNNNCEIAELLLTHGADANMSRPSGRNPLIIATSEGHYEMLELLLKYGANPNVNELQYTALFFTCNVKEPRCDLRFLTLLLKNGADINWQPLGTHTDTVLIHSVRKWPYEYIKYLCDNNANIDIAGEGGNTALMEAIRVCRHDIVDLLLKRKALVNICNPDGYTALDYALFNLEPDTFSQKNPKNVNSIIKLLREHGARTGNELTGKVIQKKWHRY